MFRRIHIWHRYLGYTIANNQAFPNILVFLDASDDLDDLNFFNQKKKKKKTKKMFDIDEAEEGVKVSLEMLVT